jgi:hypothetical protein
MGVLWTICPGWLGTTILPISASWVGKITGMSHLHPVAEILHMLNLEKQYLPAHPYRTRSLV